MEKKDIAKFEGKCVYVLYQPDIGMDPYCIRGIIHKNNFYYINEKNNKKIRLKPISKGGINEIEESENPSELEKKILGYLKKNK